MLLSNDATLMTAELLDTNLAELEQGLTQGELALVTGAPEARRREFAAGRWLARAALKRLGHAGCELLWGPGRVPSWPQGFGGSISHCETRAIVAVAPALGGSIGIDVETRRQLKRAVWSKVLLPDEVDALRRGYAAVEQESRALLWFSAKEALYKALYPLCHQQLGLLALAVVFRGEPAAQRGHFVATLQVDAGQFRRGHRLEGRFWLDAFDTGELLTGVVIAPAETSQSCALGAARCVRSRGC